LPNKRGVSSFVALSFYSIAYVIFKKHVTFFIFVQYIRSMGIHNKPAANSKDVFSEAQLDALAGVLAEGFLHLAMTGKIDEVFAEETAKTGPADGLIDRREGR
jgi:hypothetical protein